VLFRTNAGGIGYCCSTGCCCRCAKIIDTQVVWYHCTI
jgi:hypothetical protein